MPTELEPFSGTETMRASPERTFAVLTDLPGLPPLIPGLVTSELVDPHTLRATVKPGFGFIRSTMKLVITLTEAQPSDRARLHITSSGIGAGMEIDAQLQISPTADGSATEVHWSARVQKLSGLLAHVGTGLIQGAAQQVIADGWSAMRRKIES